MASTVWKLTTATDVTLYQLHQRSVSTEDHIKELGCCRHCCAWCSVSNF